MICTNGVQALSGQMGLLLELLDEASPHLTSCLVELICNCAELPAAKKVPAYLRDTQQNQALEQLTAHKHEVIPSAVAHMGNCTAVLMWPRLCCNLASRVANLMVHILMLLMCRESLVNFAQCWKRYQP